MDGYAPNLVHGFNLQSYMAYFLFVFAIKSVVGAILTITEFDRSYIFIFGVFTQKAFPCVSPCLLSHYATKAME